MKGFLNFFALDSEKAGRGKYLKANAVTYLTLVALEIIGTIIWQGTSSVVGGYITISLTRLQLRGSSILE